MYEDAFETKFLKATEALYHEEGNRYMQETDVSYHLFQYLYPRGWMGSKKACPLYNQLSKLACPGQVKVYLFSFLVPRLTTCGAWALAYQANYNEQFKLTWYENLPVLALDNQTFF